MLIFDQLKKNDPQLRVVAMVILAGLGVLLGGLWWVQVVSARAYQANLETQSFRTVRIPAVRGRIFDGNGAVLAENQPAYNVSLYLEELRKPFDQAYLKAAARARAALKERADEEQKKLNRKLTKAERKQFILGSQQRELLREQTRFEVASNFIAQISERIQQPLSLDATNFERHYETRLALPFPVMQNLSSSQIARLEEQTTSALGVDLDVQSTRVYPYGTAAAHILGSLRRDDSSAEGEDAFFSYRLPDYRGMVGIEAGFDRQLRGTAGAKSVLVNNVGYRQTENVWSPAAAGQNVVLTIDLRVQQAAEHALQSAYGPTTRGAAVVMDVITGDILALASSPTLNPNHFIQGFTHEEWERITELRAEINLATQENYQPGSTFKTVVGMAALEAGLDPNQSFRAEANPHEPGRAWIHVGGQAIRDLAPPGEFNFRRAFKLSSNCYFITNGIRTGISRIVELGHRLHLGERTGLPTRQEVAGSFPAVRTVSENWFDGQTANICIGQGEIAVTPLQMTVMTAAIANGGKVLWPRLVQRVESQDRISNEPPTVFPAGRVRDELGVKPRTLEIVREAMLADVEDSDGTGREASVPGMRIAGKTGTAQKKDQRGVLQEHVLWFASFGDLVSAQRPRYAVLVMVEMESGGSGGKTCAPIAGKIYTAIRDRLSDGRSIAKIR
jgi:penicillin-binding protein 2